jgi:hypothetical protein
LKHAEKFEGGKLKPEEAFISVHSWAELRVFA